MKHMQGMHPSMQPLISFHLKVVHVCIELLLLFIIQTFGFHQNGSAYRLSPINLDQEEVAVCAGCEVLVEADDYIRLIVGTP